MDNLNNSFITQILLALKDVLIGSIGGAVAYFLKYSRLKNNNIDHSFSFMLLIINIFVGGYAAYMFGSTIDTSFKFKDFIIGAIGVASYPILSFIEAYGVNLFIKKIEQLTGINVSDITKNQNEKK